MTNDMRALVSAIERHNSFFLVSHIDPDGDAIGSLIALSLLLERRGKRVVAYDRDGVPEIYSFLECSDRITTEVPADDFDVVIFLECPTVKRAGPAVESLLQKIPLWINLDHHVDNSRYGAVNIVDDGLSAIAELIVELFGELDEPLDKIAAEALYTAIMTDTGSFAYGNTTPRTHRIAAELIELGIRVNDVYRKVFENLSPAAALISARAHATLEIDGEISCITVTRAMFEETGATAEDTHDIVNFGRGINNVEVALLFREVDGGAKVSLRSKDRVDVSKIAAIFGGGGHVRAAGCTVEGDMRRVKDQVFPAVRRALAESDGDGH